MFVFLRALKCVSTLLVYALFCGLDVIWFFWNGLWWFPNRSDMAWILVMGFKCHSVQIRQTQTSACLFCFTWDTYTQTSVDMVDRCIPRLKVVFSWQRAVFRLRAIKDIRSQLEKKLSSAYFTSILQFLGWMFKMRSYYRNPTCIKKYYYCIHIAVIPLQLFENRGIFSYSFLYSNQFWTWQI